MRARTCSGSGWSPRSTGTSKLRAANPSTISLPPSCGPCFDIDHAFGFFSKLDYHVFDSPVRYEPFADLGPDPGSKSRSVKRTKVAEAFPEVGSKLQFLFDYGDDWRFQVEVIGTGEKTAKTRYPKVLAEVGEAPLQYPDPEEEDEDA